MRHTGEKWLFVCVQVCANVPACVMLHKWPFFLFVTVCMYVCDSVCVHKCMCGFVILINSPSLLWLCMYYSSSHFLFHRTDCNLSTNPRTQDFRQSPYVEQTIIAIFAYAEAIKKRCPSDTGVCSRLRSTSPLDFHRQFLSTVSLGIVGLVVCLVHSETP